MSTIDSGHLEVSDGGGVVAWTLNPLVSVVACLLEGAINAAQIQR